MSLLRNKDQRKKLREDFYRSLEVEGADIVSTLKTLRKILGWEQKAMADAAGISLSALRRMEQGGTNIRLDTLEKVLKRFSLKMVIKLDKP